MVPVVSVIGSSLQALRFWELLRGESVGESGLRERIPVFVRGLDSRGVRWCLAGAHAVGVYTEPRVTQNIDFIVDDRRIKSVLRSLEDGFGELEVQDVGAAVRLMRLSVDLIRSSAHPLFRAAMERATELDGWRVPSVEALMALKFMAATSAWRGANRKRQDAVDLVALYEATDRLDHALLTELAGLVYPGAARQLFELLERVDRGEPLTL